MFKNPAGMSKCGHIYFDSGTLMIGDGGVNCEDIMYYFIFCPICGVEVEHESETGNA